MQGDRGLFLDGVYADGATGLSTRVRWVKAPTSAELMQRTHTIAQRVGRFLERQGLLEHNAENSYLAGDAIIEGPLDQQYEPLTLRRIDDRTRLGFHTCDPHNRPDVDPLLSIEHSQGRNSSHRQVGTRTSEESAGGWR